MAGEFDSTKGLIPLVFDSHPLYETPLSAATKTPLS